MRVLIGCEKYQEVCKAFRAIGHEAYSCDIQDCAGDHPEWHLKMDVFEAIKIGGWDMGIFFPDCTYLTCSAEWAYTDGPYHQKVKPGTLVGMNRREARTKAVAFFMSLVNCGIPKIAIENPIGVMSREYRKPDQIIQPHQFGENASKSTCLWLFGLPLLTSTVNYPPRIVNSRPRWGNQTDTGQNKLPPSSDRAGLRGKTYPGIAQAMANQWGK
jgi:hypothetical protein